MRPRSPRPAARVADEGFVLVGVVMLVLALTILGLSLFGLSSYETQFLSRSFDRAQAENMALGELERAKYRLTVSPYNLATAASNLPSEVVTLARQVQGGDTVSDRPVDWDSGEPVVISVDASYRGLVRRVEGRFNPQQRANFYKRLVTSAGTVTVNGDANGIDRQHTVILGGRVWQNSADTTWTEIAQNWTRGIRLTGVEPPGVPRFVSEHLAGAAWPSHPDPNTITLTAPVDDVGFFTVNPGWPEATTPSYSFRTAVPVTLKVRGHVVWVIPQGIRFDDPVTVQGLSADASLAIVSPPNGRDQQYHDYRDVGVWFFGGLSSPSVPVILVSDGGVYVEQFYDQNASTYVDQLSIFAGSVFLTGPQSGGSYHMQLNHGSAMDDVIDWYALHSALPNTSPTGDHDLALVPGTWQMKSP